MKQFDSRATWLHCLDMAKTLEQTERDQEAVAQEVLRELEARRGTLSNEEVFALLRRLPPKLAPGETSADDIRELRGPLPDDDPDFVNVDRR
jgi:hypothetical protein